MLATPRSPWHLACMTIHFIWAIKAPLVGWVSLDPLLTEAVPPLQLDLNQDIEGIRTRLNTSHDVTLKATVRSAVHVMGLKPGYSILKLYTHCYPWHCQMHGTDANQSIHYYSNYYDLYKHAYMHMHMISMPRHLWLSNAWHPHALLVNSVHWHDQKYFIFKVFSLSIKCYLKYENWPMYCTRDCMQTNRCHIPQVSFPCNMHACALWWCHMWSF